MFKNNYLYMKSMTDDDEMRRERDFIIIFFFLDEIGELVASEVVPRVGGVLDLGIGGDERILSANIQRVVNLPVDVAYLASRMKQALESVEEQAHGSDAHTHALNGRHERLNDVRRRLEYIRPDVVEQMRERVLAPEAEHAQCHVSDGRHGRLTMHEIAIHESVFEEGRHRVYVVLAHLANVLEHERQRFEHAVLYVQLRHAVLVH